ncbi:MAG: SDR family oxidoreductase [Myxococcales bacterium]|nr:SDR family oxidoreductase [Myxococcales bacterium]
MARLEGKRALVTGAASGIGAACALRFAQEGAAVAGLDVQQPADAAWKEAVELAPRSHFGIADVSDEAQVTEAVAAVREALGGIDVLVNAAGIAGGGPAHLVQEGDWDRVLDVNLKGTWLASKHVLPAMLEGGGGSIVHIASVEGLEGFEGGSAYNASKGGVVLLTRNMAMDYGRRGIRVNAVCPGFIETPLLESVLGDPAMATYRERIREAHQLGRLGKPEEIAQAALFLASDEASFVTGVALPVDGGFTAGHRVGLTELMGLA